MIKPFDAQTEAAASGKSSIEMATGIIRDLRQHNYGNAERNAAILIAQLEREEREIRQAMAMLAEIKSDAFVDTLGKFLQAREAQLEHAENERELRKTSSSAFERQIKESIANLEKTDTELALYDYLMGMKNAYRYALAIYKRTI